MNMVGLIIRIITKNINCGSYVYSTVLVNVNYLTLLNYNLLNIKRFYIKKIEITFFLNFQITKMKRGR